MLTINGNTEHKQIDKQTIKGDSVCNKKANFALWLEKNEKGETDRQTDGLTDGQTETDRQTETEKDRQRQRDRDKDRDRERQEQRQGQGQRQRDKERQTDRERERETEREGHKQNIALQITRAPALTCKTPRSDTCSCRPVGRSAARTDTRHRSSRGSSRSSSGPSQQ